PQKQAAVNIEERLKPLGIPMTHIVAPELQHQFPPEWQKKAHAEYAKHAGEGKGRAEAPERVRFVTYTLKYPGCNWVSLLELGQHYKRASVDATWKGGRCTVATENVRGLSLGQGDEGREPLAEVVVDGQTVPVGKGAGRFVVLERTGGKWARPDTL